MNIRLVGFGIARLSVSSDACLFFMLVSSQHVELWNLDFGFSRYVAKRRELRASCRQQFDISREREREP
jgi:hypothetical protein